MKDRIWPRMLVVQYLDEYKNMIVNARRNDSILDSICRLNGEGITSITLPSTFELIFQRNINIETFIDDQYGEIKIKEISYDWDKIETEIYLKLKKSDGISREEIDAKFLKELKMGYVNKGGEAKFLDKKAKLMAGLVIKLLKEVIKIIDVYFPIEEYGIPYEDLLVLIMASILEEKLTIEEPIPTIKQSIDVNNILLETENKYLKSLLYAKGYKFEETSELYYKKVAMYELLKKNPKFSIIVSPFIKKAQINDQFLQIGKGIDKLKSEIDANFNEIKSNFRQIEIEAYLYADKRLNKRMSVNEITSSLIEEVKNMDYKNVSGLDKEKFKKVGKGIEPSNISASIKHLCENTGFEKENQEITYECGI